MRKLSKITALVMAFILFVTVSPMWSLNVNATENNNPAEQTQQIQQQGQGDDHRVRNRLSRAFRNSSRVRKNRLSRLIRNSSRVRKNRLSRLIRNSSRFRNRFSRLIRNSRFRKARISKLFRKNLRS